jgi:hypothetical protein
METKRYNERCTKRKIAPLCKEQNEMHVCVNCKDTQKWGEQFFYNKWQLINEEITYMKIIDCNKIRESGAKVHFYTK